MKKPILSILAAMMTMMALTGCNTIRGLGEDISGVGYNISNAAENVKQRM